MENSIFAATIRSIKTFDVAYFCKKSEENKEKLCSVATIRLTTGEITQVFAWGMDLAAGQWALADVRRIPIGQPLYEGGPPSEAGKDLVFEGVMTKEHAKGAVEAMELAEKLDM